MLSLSSEQRGSFTVVKVSGNLDLTSRDQFDTYLTAARRGRRQLIIDMSDVTFMDTGCLAVIMGHYKRLSASGGLVLAGARYRPAKALWITGLAYRLPLYESVDDAIAGGPPTAAQPPADARKSASGEQPPSGAEPPAGG
jgi:anti-sigma B factor antagonist